MKINFWYENKNLNGLKALSDYKNLILNEFEENVNEIGDIYNFGKVLIKFYQYSPKLYQEHKPILKNKFIGADILDKNELNIYPISLCGISDIIGTDKSSVDMLSKESIRHIQNNNMKIVIFWGTEGWNFPLQPFLRLQEDFERIGIDVSNIKFISGNNLVVSAIKKKMLLDNINLKYQFYGEQFWELFHRKEIEYNDNYLQLQELSINKHIKHGKHRTFLNLNANIRWHRIALVSILVNQLQVSHNSYYSFLGRNYGYEMTMDRYLNDSALEYVMDSFFKEYTEDKTACIEFMRNWKPIVLDFPPDVVDKNDRIFTPLMYLDTIFSLVSESEYEEGVLFVTEKTWKPVSSNHPFLIFGNPGVLEYLKSLGYETYPELFDENYDSMDYHNKLYHIRGTLEKYTSIYFTEYFDIYNSVRDKIMYNRGLFFNRDMSNQLEKLINFITE